MKITENRRDVLQVEHNPWISRWFAWVCSGAMFFQAATDFSSDFGLPSRILALALGFGCAFLGWHFFPRTTARFNRRTKTLTIREARVAGETEIVHPLSAVEAAVAQEGGGDYAGMQSLCVIVSGESVYLEKGVVSADRNVVRDGINAWLNAKI